MGFEQQERGSNLGFSRSAPQPQHVGVRLDPKGKPSPKPAPKRPPEQRSF